MPWFTRYPDGSYELAPLKMCGYRATNLEVTDSEADDFRELEKITSSRNHYDPDKWIEFVNDPVHVISVFNPHLSIEFQYYDRLWQYPVVLGSWFWVRWFRVLKSCRRQCSQR